MHRIIESNSNGKVYEFLPVLYCGLSIPISLFMWLGHFSISKLTSSHNDNAITPTRWLFSTLAPVALMVYAVNRKGVSKSGAVLGIIVAIILSISNHAFFVSLIIFYFTSSKATKFRSHYKRKFNSDFIEGEGKRNWIQVLCNAGMPTQIALLYLLDCGSGERSINFKDHYRSSWLGMAVLCSFACCNGDTWASELGTVCSRSDPFLITTRKRVPIGTNGGVSPIGLIFSLLGGFAVGVGYYLSVIYTVDSNQLMRSPVQWPIILVGAFSGIFGSVIDSLLGASLQYSGINKDGIIVDKPGKNVRHISGFQILDNHSVNLISSIITGVFIPVLAFKFWPNI